MMQALFDHYHPPRALGLGQIGRRVGEARGLAFCRDSWGGGTSCFPAAAGSRSGQPKSPSGRKMPKMGKPPVASEARKIG